jgi:hypothetical protein
MNSSTRRRSVDASARSAPPTPTRFPANSRGITTDASKAKTKKVLSTLAQAKTIEYERRKRQLITFTEKIMKKKITAAAKKYINDNLDTVYDFISQLEHHPSVERAFPIVRVRTRTQRGLRILVDLKLPKTALPDIDPIPPELLSQFKTKIKSHIMDFVKTTPTTKRRILIDIFHNKLYQVEDISAPQDPYFGAAAEYYSTFTDAHLGIRSDDTGLESIPIIQSGLKDDVLLAILENLNGKNYCATRVFKKVCDKLRGNINQTSRELRPFVSFPERSDSPDPENPNPIRDGIVKNAINMMEYLPILLSNLHTYLISKNLTETDTLSKILNNLLKAAPKSDPQKNSPYFKNKVLKVGVKLSHLSTLLEALTSASGRVIFNDFCKNSFLYPNTPGSGYIKYLQEKLTSFTIENERDTFNINLTLLRALLSRDMARFSNLELRIIQSMPRYSHLLTVFLTSEIEPVVARPTEIPTSSVLNIPPSNVDRLPSSERVVSAELAGKKKSRRNKYIKRKTSKN